MKYTDPGLISGMFLVENVAGSSDLEFFKPNYYSLFTVISFNVFQGMQSISI